MQSMIVIKLLHSLLSLLFLYIPVDYDGSIILNDCPVDSFALEDLSHSQLTIHVLQEPGCLCPQVSLVKLHNSCEIVESRDSVKDLHNLLCFSNLFSSNLFSIVTEFSGSVTYAYLLGWVNSWLSVLP